MTITTQLLPDLDAADAARFDAFVAQSPSASYQQTRAWIAAAPRARHRQWSYLLVEEDGALIATAIVRRTRLALGYWLATLQRGPVLHDPDRLADILPGIRAALGAAGCCSVRLAPRVRGRALPGIADLLRADGFAPLATGRQALHTATGIVWLDKPEDGILAGFKQRGRRAIRAAERDGISVRPVANAADRVAFQAVLDRFAAARPEYDTSGQPDAAGQALLVDRLGGAMLLAERGGEAIGAHTFVRQADEAIWLSLATIGDSSVASPGYSLLWAAMRTARAFGCVGYDLAGLAATPPSDPGAAGRHQFKTAFAPHPRVLLPMQMTALAPLPHTVLLGLRDAYRAVKTRAAPRVAAHG